MPHAPLTIMPETDDNLTAAVERPIPSGSSNALFGSDVIADTLRALNIPYIALNPGASYRGLHDSLVNRLGNQTPQMLLCLHEEHTVAIAQGYAKVTEKPMLAAVHSNVGLLHATMAIFDAWCDRVPVIVLGATGPVDAALRRPWIEWIHTARDQGAIVRNFTKWDDQPASAAAAREAVLRGAWIANTAPKGPVYLNFDAAMQEGVVEAPLPEIDPRRFMPATAAAACPQQIAQLAEMLRAAKHPLLLIGKVSRSETDWQARIDLAEKLGARVLSSVRLAAAFPTGHKLHVGQAITRLHAAAKTAMAEADLIVSFDWLDLAGTITTAFGHLSPAAKIVHISLDHQLTNGWSMDHQALPPVDLMLATEPDAAIAALLQALGEMPARPAPAPIPMPARGAGTPPPPGRIKSAELARELRKALGGRPTCLLHVPVSWYGEDWEFNHPLDFIGGNGGGGVGAGPGISVGAALALKDSGRMPIAFLGDGDFLMGCTAIWTAAHYRVPLLIVVVNNQSFYHDEAHQQHMAERRGRNVDNRWIGMRMSDPDINIAQMGAAQGAVGLGPVTSVDELPGIYAQAIAAVAAGKTVVIDARTDTDR